MDDNYETWEPCKNFEDYEISTEGRVRNVGTDRVLKTNVNKKGYEQICLRRDGKQYTRTIHRLMGDTYMEKDNALRHNIRHKDRDKLNNCLYNLRLTYGKVNGNKKRKVKCIETGEVFDSMTDCSKRIGVSMSNISRNLNSTYDYQSKNGLHFKEVEEE